LFPNAHLNTPVKKSCLFSAYFCLFPREKEDG
jgi:hypothetical protein